MNTIIRVLDRSNGNTVGLNFTCRREAEAFRREAHRCLPFAADDLAVAVFDCPTSDLHPHERIIDRLQRPDYPVLSGGHDLRDYVAIDGRRGSTAFYLIDADGLETRVDSYAGEDAFSKACNRAPWLHRPTD